MMKWSIFGDFRDRNPLMSYKSLCSKTTHGNARLIPAKTGAQQLGSVDKFVSHKVHRNYKFAMTLHYKLQLIFFIHIYV